jgi:hypothetical protein
VTPPQRQRAGRDPYNQSLKALLAKTGKTVWDVLVLFVSLWFPRWIGVKPFSLLRVLISSALLVVIALGAFSCRVAIRDYLFAIAPGLRDRFETRRAQQLGSRPKPTPLRIAFFYVNPTSPGWAGQDGAVQKEGFDLAKKEFGEEYGAANVEERTFLYKADAHADVLKEMRELYEKNVRIFIVTMSAIVTPLRYEFKKWRETISCAGERPVLIATVTSAPNVADMNNGVLRFYIRSEDEAKELARYAWWKHQPTSVGVFHLADAYGTGGAETFATALRKLAGPTPKCCPISGDPENVSKFITNWIQNDGAGSACAYVVGYGDMLIRTIEQLDNQHFPGPILCVSTITHESWQPGRSNARVRLVTVVPERAQRETGYPAEDKDVVRFFSKVAILKGLDCARFSQTTSDFIARWQTNTPPHPQGRDEAEKNGLSVIYSTNGDAIIELMVQEMKR